jgi:acyl-coenzyme A synthetase/AMP-(fatty) acid ligase
VGVVALQEPDGAPSIGIAVVIDKPVDRNALTARCRAAVPRQLPIHIVQLDAIPRNEGGKILRRELATRISAARAHVEAERS